MNDHPVKHDPNDRDADYKMRQAQMFMGALSFQRNAAFLHTEQGKEQGKEQVKHDMTPQAGETSQRAAAPSCKK